MVGALTGKEKVPGSEVLEVLEFVSVILSSNLQGGHAGRGSCGNPFPANRRSFSIDPRPQSPDHLGEPRWSGTPNPQPPTPP